MSNYKYDRRYVYERMFYCLQTRLTETYFNFDIAYENEANERQYKLLEQQDGGSKKNESFICSPLWRTV